MGSKTKDRSRFLAVLLAFYYLCIAIYNPNFYGFNFSNYIIILMFVMTVREAKGIIRVQKIPFVLLSVLYSIFLIALMKTGSGEGISRFIKLLIPIFIVLVFSCIMQNEDGKKKVISILALANIAACITGIINYYVFYDRGYTMVYLGTKVGRMRGSFAQPNVFATFLSMTVPFAMYYAWEKISELKRIHSRNLGRVVVLVVVIINFFCIFMAKSRWSMITIIIQILAIPVISHRTKNRNKVALSIIGTVFLGMVMIWLLYSNHTVVDFFARRGSNRVRSEGLVQAYKLSEAHYFMGLGLSYGIGEILDSTFMNLLIDTGIIGIIVFASICFDCIYRLLQKRSKNDQKIRWPFSIMFLGFCIEMVAESILFNSLINSFLGIVWYLCWFDDCGQNLSMEE